MMVAAIAEFTATANTVESEQSADTSVTLHRIPRSGRCIIHGSSPPSVNMPAPGFSVFPIAIAINGTKGLDLRRGLVCVTASDTCPRRRQPYAKTPTDVL